jgi:TonB family protein
MKQILIFLMFYNVSLQAQDTLVYDLVEETAMLPGCEEAALGKEEKVKCAQQLLLGFVYENIIYPEEARTLGAEGTVVVRFIIEKDGSLSTKEILKDIDGGCGQEVLRVIDLLSSTGVRWIPAKNKGQEVRSRITLPVKFKLEEPLPYQIVGLDTIYLVYDTPLDFKGGSEALSEMLEKNLVYPKKAEEDCKVGKIEVELMIQGNGNVRVMDLIDYSGLGSFFWDAAVTTVTSTYGYWTPAIYDGKPVTTSLNLTVSFVPDFIYCKAVSEAYTDAINWMNEANLLIEEGDFEGALTKMTLALEEFPENGEFLIARGQLYLDQNQFSEACNDLSKAKEITLINWFDEVLNLICR